MRNLIGISMGTELGGSLSSLGLLGAVRCLTSLGAWRWLGPGYCLLCSTDFWG